MAQDSPHLVPGAWRAAGRRARWRRLRWWPGAGLALLAAAGLLLLTLPAPSPPGPALPSAQDGSAPAITVQVGQPGAPISPLIYGIGGGASTSTYLPADPTWAARLAATLRFGGVTALRFGGGSADDFDWEQSRLYGIDGAFQRVGNPGSAYPGIDTFLAFARRNHLEPIIAVNAEIDDPQKAARLVDYIETHGPPVTYWEIGNEPYLWTHVALDLRQRRLGDRQKASPDDYAAIVVAYARAMQAAASRHPRCARAPQPQHCLRIIADEWITNATDQSWTSSVDLIDTHYYSFLGGVGPQQTPASDADVAAGALTSATPSRLSLTAWLDDLGTAMDAFVGSEHLQVMVGSWGLDGSELDVNHYADFAQGLFTAEMLGQMIQARRVQIATTYAFYGADQSPVDNEGLPRAGLHALALVTRYFGHWVLPGSTNASAGDASLWAVAGATARQHGDLTLLVVNTAQHGPVRATIILQDSAPAATVWQPRADVWTLQHDAPEGSPSYGTTGIHHSVAPLSLGAHSFTYSFPPFAITLLRLHRR